MPRARSVAVCFLVAFLIGACGSEDKQTGTSARDAAESILRLPYDVEVDGEGRIYIADGALHQVLRLDPRTGQVSVVVGTGEPGSDGDGGPAKEAQINEPVGLALAADGTLFIADFPENRVRRVDADGTISTLAKVRMAAEAALDHRARHLVVPSLADVVRRIDLESGRMVTVTRADSPHGAAFDEAGNLYFPDGNYIRRMEVRNEEIETVAGNGVREATGDGGLARRAGVDAVKLLVAPDGSLYVVGGDLYGGTVRRITPDGTIEAVVGTGGLGPNGEGGLALEAGIQPSDVALAEDGALIVSQIEPVPAVRRVDPETGVITTLLR